MDKKSVDNLVLSADDICKILEVAAKSGVTTLTAHGLCVSFKGSVGPQDQAYAPESPQHEEVSANSLAEQQELIQQARIDEMIINDPVGYEESVMRGDLVDEETQS